MTIEGAAHEMAESLLQTAISYGSLEQRQNQLSLVFEMASYILASKVYSECRVNKYCRSEVVGNILADIDKILIKFKEHSLT